MTDELTNPGLTQAMAVQELGDKVTIEKVDGGYIVRWEVVVVMPEHKRQWGDSRRLKKTAVRANLEHALNLVGELLSAEKVVKGE
jgi:hypothetical protein